MADYQAASRSNYVRFDPIKLQILLELFPDLSSVTDENGRQALIAEGSTPQASLDDEDRDFDELLQRLGAPPQPNDDWVEFLDVVHLALTDTPIVWLEVGHEKSKFLSGIALRIAPDGITTTINLDSIYQDGDTRAEF